MLQTSMSYICSTPELPERNFCDGLQIQLASQVGYNKLVPQKQLRKPLLLAFACS